MNTSTLSRLAYHDPKEAPIINIADKKERQSGSNQRPVNSGAKQFIMPPITHAYIKGRDNDPL